MEKSRNMLTITTPEWSTIIHRAADTPTDRYRQYTLRFLSAVERDVASDALLRLTGERPDSSFIIDNAEPAPGVPPSWRFVLQLGHPQLMALMNYCALDLELDGKSFTQRVEQSLHIPADIRRAQVEAYRRFVGATP
jgi:hypothetical protein